MADRFVLSITHGKDDADKATVGFVVANAALASGRDTLVFLSTEEVYLSQREYADSIHVCSPCFKNAT
jgi:predicted peroxiredoxin